MAAVSVKRSIGLDKQNSNSLRASLIFLYISLLLLGDHGPVISKDNHSPVIAAISYPNDDDHWVRNLLNYFVSILKVFWRRKLRKRKKRKNSRKIKSKTRNRKKAKGKERAKENEMKVTASSYF